MARNESLPQPLPQELKGFLRSRAATAFALAGLALGSSSLTNACNSATEGEMKKTTGEAVLGSFEIGISVSLLLGKGVTAYLNRRNSNTPRP